MQRKILLSIKPEFAEKIFNGCKKFEFRKAIFKDKNVKKIIVYASSPISKVIGEFTIDEILCEKVNILWDKTRMYSGVDESFYFEYFSKRDIGYAIKIKKYRRYKYPFDLKKNMV